MRVRLFAGGPGRGHISRMEAVAEVLEERGHDRVDLGADFWVVDAYDFDWDSIPDYVLTVHVDDFNRPNNVATLHFKPLRGWALVRRAFREVTWTGGGGVLTPHEDCHGLSATQMAAVMARADEVVTPASVTAWEALTVGAPVTLLPPNDNQALAYDAIRTNPRCDGRGAERIVEAMEICWREATGG